MSEEKQEKNIEELVERSVQKAVSKAMTRSNLLKNGISWLLNIALIVGLVFIYNQIKPKNPEVAQLEDHDMTLENNGIFGFTAVDFEEAILGQATRQQLLIVDEQEVSVAETISNAGLFNWKLFNKAQNQTIYGTGEYTIDLTQIDKNDIELDEETFTVTIHVPYPELHNVIFDPEKTKIGDTDKGLLAFGEIKMTPEQTQQYQVEAVNKLTERLNEDDCFDKAVRYTRMSAYDVYQPIVSSVSPAYKVEIVVDDALKNQN